MPHVCTASFINTQAFIKRQSIILVPAFHHHTYIMLHEVLYNKASFVGSDDNDRC
jgi:hypothetical protein